MGVAYITGISVIQGTSCPKNFFIGWTVGELLAKMQLLTTWWRYWANVLTGLELNAGQTLL